MIRKPQFLIGAATSGSGKTTFTMGLLYALKSRGMNVQPFKCGPDYIDTQFHSVASGNISVNLDTWMSSERHVAGLYGSYGKDADVCVIEGVMGLFDGYDKMKGSSADISRLLDIPVILVVNAKSVAYSVAPLIHGFSTYHPGVRIAGVVFNQVSSASHYKFLKDACSDIDVPCLGYLPKDDRLKVPSRHLGLTLMAKKNIEEIASAAAGLIEEYVDIDLLLSVTDVPFVHEGNFPTSFSGLNINTDTDAGANRPFRISVAYDEAFNFVYRANIDRLKCIGDVRYFSVLHTEDLPDSDFVYIPGGYPELFAEQISRNTKLLCQLKEFSDRGGRIFAECGGFMLLSESITLSDGIKYPMAGVFPIGCTMEGARLHLGYRQADYHGIRMRGHEFHYSKISTKVPHLSASESDGLDSCGKMTSEVIQYNARGEATDTSLFRYKNTLAGYTHWYWGETDLMRLYR